jgi:hypothetical protein
MAKPSAYDRERIAHINYLMDTINDSSNVIYESLVDREFKPLKKELKDLISFLREIESSLEDEI